MYNAFIRLNMSRTLQCGMPGGNDAYFFSRTIVFIALETTGHFFSPPPGFSVVVFHSHYSAFRFKRVNHKLDWPRTMAGRGAAAEGENENGAQNLL